MYKIFPWKRFWCSRTGTISLNDNGFLLDPESEYAHYYHKDVVAFEKIQKTPCLVLLGEPGVGKTTTLNSEIKILSDQLVGKTDVLFHKNLNEYGDESNKRDI
jgi:predicted ATPase